MVGRVESRHGSTFMARDVRLDPEMIEGLGIKESVYSQLIEIQTATDAIDATIAQLITADELHGLRAGLAAYRVIRGRQGD
jgi:hypothetical protein